MADTLFDVIILGGGPGGYVGAIRAAQLGFRTAIVEKRPRLGGTCLNIGCIPSKALLDSSEHYAMAKHQFAAHGIRTGDLSIDVPTMIARKNKVVDELTRGLAGLMKKNKIAVFEGTGRLTSAKTVAIDLNDGTKTELTAGKNILIATGSVPIELPFAPCDEKVIVSSTGALDLDRVPKRLVVVGAGYIGLELGSVWRRLGSEVIVVEMFDKIVPFLDREIAAAFHKSLVKLGMEFRFSTKVAGIDNLGDSAKVKVVGPDGKEEIIETDRVLVAIGRKPFTKGIGLEDVGVALDDKGRIAVDDHFRTNVEGISALGDLVRGPMLAHKAEEEGVAWAELLADKAGHVNYDAIPSVIYTWPEVASVGLSEEEARERHGDDVRIGKFAFLANGRAKAMGERDGFVKVVSGPRGLLLGVHIIGPRASDMIAEATTVLEFGGTAEDIARTCHAHPTLSEALKEAALSAEGRVIHS